MAQFPVTSSEADGVTFAVLNLCNTHNSGNVACFNYSMYRHKLESARGLWFRLYCQGWRTFQGHRQSPTRTLYVGNVAV